MGQETVVESAPQPAPAKAVVAPKTKPTDNKPVEKERSKSAERKNDLMKMGKMLSNVVKRDKSADKAKSSEEVKEVKVKPSKAEKATTSEAKAIRFLANDSKTSTMRKTESKTASSESTKVTKSMSKEGS